VDTALLAGRSLAEAAPDSEVRKALLALAREVGGIPEQDLGRGRRGA